MPEQKTAPQRKPRKPAKTAKEIVSQLPRPEADPETPLFTEVWETIPAVPTFEPATPHQEFLQRNGYFEWFNDTFGYFADARPPHR